MSQSMRFWLIRLFLLTLFLGFLFGILSQRLRLVRTPEHGDQASYLELAVHLKNGDGFVTKRLSPFYPSKEITQPEPVRQPLLPLLLSLSAKQELSFFKKAQWQLWFFSLICLILLYLIGSRFFSPDISFLWVALLGLNIHFQVYATEIWCENLLLLGITAGGLFIHEYLFTEKIWKQNKWMLTVAGICITWGYYAKSSALALPIAFALLCIYRLIRILVRKKSNQLVLKYSFTPFYRLIIPMVLLILPYVVMNLVNTGSFSRNRELRAAMWVSEGSQYYLPAKEPPSLRKLIKEQPFSYFTNRIGQGMLSQVGNHLDALKIVPFEKNRILSSVFLVIALIHLLRYPGRGWRGFLLALLIFNFLTAAWYSVIDVAPRFIYVSIPFLYLHAVLGMRKCVLFVGDKIKRTPLSFISSGALYYILPSIFLALFFWNQKSLFESPTPQLLKSEQIIIRKLTLDTQPDDILLMGPSHKMPWNFIFDRRFIFVPHYSNWNEVLNYADYFGADYFLLDWDVVRRRATIFFPYFTFSRENGLGIQKLPDRLELLYQDPYFIFCRIEPKNF